MIEFRNIDDMHQEIAEIASFEPEIAGRLNKMLLESTTSEEYNETGDFIKTYHTLTLYGSTNDDEEEETDAVLV